MGIPLYGALYRAGNTTQPGSGHARQPTKITTRNRSPNTPTGPSPTRHRQETPQNSPYDPIGVNCSIVKGCAAHFPFNSPITAPNAGIPANGLAASS